MEIFTYFFYGPQQIQEGGLVQYTKEHRARIKHVGDLGQDDNILTGFILLFLSTYVLVSI